MFLIKKNVVKAQRNVDSKQSETARKADQIRELQLAILDRVSGGICRRDCL